VYLDEPAPPQQTGVPAPGDPIGGGIRSATAEPVGTQTTREDLVVENGWYESVSLSDYIGVVWRRKWIALLVTVMVTAAAIGFSERQQKLFAATSQLVNTTVAANASSGKSAPTNAWSSAHAPLLATTTAAQAVLKAANLSNISAQQLLNETKVSADPVVDAVDFTVTDPNAQSAVKLANAWALYAGAYANDLDKAPLEANIKGLNTDIARLTQEQTDYREAVAASIKPKITQLQFDLDTQQIKKDTSTIIQKRAALQGAGYALGPKTAPPAAQTQPKTTRNAAIGLVLGLILGIILAFLQDLLDTRVRTVAEVGRRLRLPLLASIPARPRALREYAVVLLSPQGAAQMPTAEAYRIFKLNLATTLRRGMKVIMFTSASDDEGTSTTVANLAVALTRAGQHVVVVDANMRRPALGSFFGLDDRMGVSDILSGHSQLGDALTIVDVSREHPVDIGSNGTTSTSGGGLLEVLPAGPIPGDAAELLDSRAMTELLRELRGRADVVLVDAPPMLPVTDAMVLGTKVDAVVAVARARLASRPHLVALGRALDACAAPRLGFVFVGGAADESQEYGGYLGGTAPAEAMLHPSQARETELL
jgi:capsular exopolysaccharide synthesis family protein